MGQTQPPGSGRSVGRERAADRKQRLTDTGYMRRALSEARRGRGTSWPNPMVGALIVRGGRVVGRGFHRRPGEPHAEVNALGRARRRARGSTVYVTLEPCSHCGRTPPCADALIEAGVARVVFSHYDPNPTVAGRGAEQLRAAGIDVSVGVLGDEARRLNEVFVRLVTSGRPFVTLKSATTLDGCVATASGHSQWITGVPARRRVHAMRRDHGAVLVGVGTVLADDPSLTVREVPGPSPLRIVLDSWLRTPATARLATTLAQGTVFVCREDADLNRRSALEAAGATVWPLPAAADGRPGLTALLERAAEESIPSILVEGGRAVFTSFLQEGRADKLCAFVAPRIIGGGLGLTLPLARERMDEALELHAVRVHAFGQDALLEGYFDPYFASNATELAVVPRD